jgi:hypothetical protein
MAQRGAAPCTGSAWRDRLKHACAQQGTKRRSGNWCRVKATRNGCFVHMLLVHATLERSWALGRTHDKKGSAGTGSAAELDGVRRMARRQS